LFAITDKSPFTAFRYDFVRPAGVVALSRWRVEKLKRRAAVLGVALATLPLAVPGVAHAEGFLDFLFGGPHGPHGRPLRPAPVSGYAERPARAPLRAETVHDGGGSAGHTAAFCVRLCDGENFPLQHLANATPVETCRALCPASATKVFFGTGINNAVAGDGARYTDLDNAYVYRNHLVAQCTCNGRDAFGLASPATANDPTLRPGDIVVTQKGLLTYAGARGQSATYTPVDPSSIRAELNSVTAPPRDPQHATPSADDETGAIVVSRNAPLRYLPPVVDLRGQLDK
jgi:hypothetical protein